MCVFFFLHLSHLICKSRGNFLGLLRLLVFVLRERARDSPKVSSASSSSSSSSLSLSLSFLLVSHQLLFNFLEKILPEKISLMNPLSLSLPPSQEETSSPLSLSLLSLLLMLLFSCLDCKFLFLFFLFLQQKLQQILLSLPLLWTVASIRFPLALAQLPMAACSLGE